MTRGPTEDWVLATTSAGKLAEYRALLADTPIRLHPLNAARGEAPEETGQTFIENALIKARHAAAVSGTAAMADDSGLCVAALDGAPGVHSARYAGPGASDRANIDKLLNALDNPVADRSAAFHCVIVAVRSPADPAPVIATGRWPGRIATEAAGTGGFGYDPVFFDPEQGLTAAELDAETKNAISHRGRAVAELRELLGFRTRAR
mgnify:CR=1 FL=1